MRVRFLRVVGLRTGPQYNPGEEADLPEIQAADLLARGCVERVVVPEAPKAESIEAPPVDRAMKRDRTVRR